MTLSTAPEREAFAEHLRIAAAHLGVDRERARRDREYGVAADLSDAQRLIERAAKSLITAERSGGVPMRGP